MMRRALSVPGIVIACLLLAITAVADTAQNTPAGGPAPAADGAASAQRERPTAAEQRLSPQMREIQAALAQEHRAIQEILSELEAADDEDAAMELLARLHDVKRDTEVEILRIQARHARLAGREELAREIDAAIERLLAPPPTPVPQERAVPEPTPQR